MKRSMMCVRVAVVATIQLAAPSARAAVTNVVDVSALRAVADNSTETSTNGWTLYCIDTYADSSLRFNANADWLLSPDYGADIVGVVATVRCSATNATRWVSVVNDADGVELASFFVCSKKDTLQEQVLSFGDIAGVRRIKFKFGNGGSGNAGWGIGSLSVITADPIEAPTALAVVKTNATSCVLEWENGANTISNRIDTYLVDVGIGDKVIYKTDFDGFYGNATTTRDFTGNVSELLGDSFSGIRVYGAAGTTGICQLGTGKDFGILRCAGLSSYERINLTMTAKRYSGDNADTIVAYEEDGSTNAIKTITLTDEFAEYSVDLSKDAEGNEVPGGAAILIGYWTPTKSNRRVLIDSLSIVRTGADTETLVDSRFVPAAPGAMRLSTKGAFDLVPNAEYRFEVSAQSGDGLLSSWVSAEARLLAEVPGFGIILR